MSEKWKIRGAIPADTEALARLSHELGYPSDAGAVARRLRRVLAAPDHQALVAVRADGSVVGWIHVFAALHIESDPFAEIGGLVVASTHRGLGIGAALQAAAESWARDQGLRSIRVRSRVERRRTHAFYESGGFERLKTQIVFEKTTLVNDH
jgi:GNAT superfamily N-acetyltransferase